MLAREYEMIEYCAVERFRRGRQPSRDPAVTVARPCIAARMIVREHDARAAQLRGVEDDLAQRDVGPALVAAMARNLKTPRFVVDMSDPQAFAAGVLLGEAAGEELARRREAIKLQREFGTLIPHDATLR